MTKYYIEVMRERRSATTEFAEYWARFNVAGTHLIMVRDLFQHVIRRMLEPEAIGIVAHYHINYFQNKFYGSHEYAERAILMMWDPSPDDVRITEPSALRDILSLDPPPKWHYAQNCPVRRFHCML